jgi:adenylyltransferase/sulfurtransferase
MQAAEALKVLVGESSLTGRLLLWDARTGSAETIAFERRASCNGHVSGPVACPLPWNAPQVPDISAADFEARRGEFFLVDVREPEEFAEVRIPGSTLIPLGELPRRLGELPRNRSIVIHCAVGGRSARATELLREHGFAAWNLRGGIQAWLASFG